MITFQLFYSTSELIPPPYSYNISLNGTINSEQLLVDFSIEYTFREDLTPEEIETEGFTMEDDFNWKGEFGEIWAIHFRKLIEKCIDFDENTSSTEAFCKILVEDKVLQPVDIEQATTLLEELKQAIFEKEEYESPLKITVIRKNSSQQNELVLEASFVDLMFTVTQKGKKNNLPWESLSDSLNKIYNAELFYEKATNKFPTKNGLFLNLGDEWWFEVGKSYIGSPTNLLRFFDL